MRPQRLPVEEIRFAAKTGFLSKPIWEEFFAQGSDRWRRRQWQLFSERGFFIRHPSRLPKDVLVLYRKNPIVKSVVGETVSLPPFAPQIEHDELVIKILLRLQRSGLILDVQFESELKRESWSEKRFHSTDKLKLPDGIFILPSTNSVLKIAVELELSRKNPKRYRDILSAYAARKDLSHVLFIARSKLIFDSLKNAMRDTYYPDWERPIGFCNLDEWLEKPNRAPIYLSSGLSSLDQIASTHRVIAS